MCGVANAHSTVAMELIGLIKLIYLKINLTLNGLKNTLPIY